MTSESPPTTFGTRLLKSHEPDLEVVLGPDKTVLRYHSRILASYSEYIDTMLSVDMKERSTKRITFPDILPEAWTKLLRFLEPGGCLLGYSVEDYLEMIPLYDKYRFHVALEMIDGDAPKIFKSELENEPSSAYNCDLLPRFAFLCYDHNLPRSKTAAIEYAKTRLRQTITVAYLEESGIQELLPLVQDDEKTLKYIFGTVLGNDIREMNVEAMRTAIEDESFATTYIARCEHVQLQAQIRGQLKLNDVRVTLAGDDMVNGRYDKKYSHAYRRFGFGAPFIKKIEGGGAVFLESVDPFGKCWQFRLVEDYDEEALMEEEWNAPQLLDAVERRGRVIYKWQSSFSSLFPPKLGWSAVDNIDLPPPELDYYYVRSY